MKNRLFMLMLAMICSVFVFAQNKPATATKPAATNEKAMNTQVRAEAKPSDTPAKMEKKHTKKHRKAHKATKQNKVEEKK
ncbi:MAG: hypothetical protein IT268_04700 [Saprospiraceae bacterium]|nr:hypothetical protein [Saprospiraceae bacterium]